jgi:uncharacterized membrane protein
LLGRRLTLTGAGLLFGLFALQLVLPDIRNELSYVYIALAIVTIVVQRKAALRVVRDAFASPADEAQPPLKSAQPRPS